LEAALDRVEHRQALAVSQMQDRYENRARAIRSTLAQLGLRAQPAAPASGGPFVPIKLASEDGAFGRALSRVNLARADANALSTTLLKVPRRRRHRREFALRHSHGSFCSRSSDAYRNRFSRRYRRSNPRHSRGQRYDRGIERRLWQDGRDRPRQRLSDPPQPSLPDRRRGRRHPAPPRSPPPPPPP